MVSILKTPKDMQKRGLHKFLMIIIIIETIQKGDE